MAPARAQEPGGRPRRLARPKKAGQNSVLAADRNVPTRAWGILGPPNSPPKSPRSPISDANQAEAKPEAETALRPLSIGLERRRRVAPKAGNRGPIAVLHQSPLPATLPRRSSGVPGSLRHPTAESARAISKIAATTWLSSVLDWVASLRRGPWP